MSQEPPEDRTPEEELPPEREAPEEAEQEEEELEEALSGTLLGSLHQATRGMGAYGTALFGGGLFAIILGGVVHLFVDDLRTHASVILGVGAVLLMLGMALSWQSVQSIIGARRGRYGINTVVMIGAFLGIAAVGSFLGFEHTSRMDVTATNQFSLSNRTKELLKDLDLKVEAKAFFVEDDPQQLVVLEFVEDMLKEFDVRSGKFSYDIVDPDKSPIEAANYNVTRYGTIAFRFVDENNDIDRLHLVDPSQFLEQDFVTAILIVTAEEQKNVYFLTNHQEKDIDDGTGNDGFGVAAFAGLRGDNYNVAKLSLLGGVSEVPDDATLVIIAGPTQDMFSGEVDALNDYLKHGGLMMVLADPDIPQTYRDFLARWGVQIEDGYIVDKSRSLEDSPQTTVITGGQYYHALPALVRDALVDQVLLVDELTEPLGATSYPGLAALSPIEDVAFSPIREIPDEEEDLTPPHVFGAALAFTTGNSWLIDDPLRTDPDESDRRGPFIPAMAIRALAPVDEGLPSDLGEQAVASIVVIGDSDFATNQNFYGPGSNSDFFLNAVNWLAGDVALHEIRPKPIVFRELTLDKNQRNFVRYSSWFMLPAAMALLAGFVWWRRR